MRCLFLLSHQVYVNWTICGTAFLTLLFQGTSTISFCSLFLFFVVILFFFFLFIFRLFDSGWAPVLLIACSLPPHVSGSTPMTEGLTLVKYPSYAFYQQATSRLIPLFSATTAKTSFVDQMKSKSK